MGGYHFLYADTFLTRAEFEEMFDLTAYEAARRKYFAEGTGCPISLGPLCFCYFLGF